MECKNCNAQLEEGVTLCPQCGTDNTPAEQEIPVQEAPVQETQEPAVEMKPGIMLTPGKLVAIVAGVVVLTALVVTLIMQGMGFSFTAKPQETEPEVTIPQVTTPADGNPDDVTCKGSYTVFDAEIAEAHDTVVATVGDAQLTNGQLQIYYWLEVQNFLANYGSYAAYFGLDYTQPLDTQVCGLTETPMTWQQYFLDSALADWHNYQALALEAAENGFQLEQTYLDMIDGLPESLATDAGLQGFGSAEEYLAYNVGQGATIADYQHYMRTYYEGFVYFQSRYEEMVPTLEEMETYFAEHEEELTAAGISKDDVLVDVRHILVLPEGATVENIRTETFSEEAWAVGEKNAQDILNRWLSGEQTEENFAALANETSADPGSNTAGGLYTDVYVGQMVEEFEAWCFDEARKPGDYGIVKTSLGYHIMYFSASRPAWHGDVEQEILGVRGSELINAATAKHTMDVEYSKIAIGDVQLGA